MNIGQFLRLPATRIPSDLSAASAADPKAREGRPAFVFRFQIILAFAAIFVLSVAIIAGAILTVHKVEQLLLASQAWQSFLFEAEQARRWEKNFFLYGTNLKDALEATQKARSTLLKNLASLQELTDPHKQEEMLLHIEKYNQLLEDIFNLVQQGTLSERVKEEIEISLRRYGALVVDDAAEVSRRQSIEALSWLDILKKVPLYYLFFHFVLVLWLTRFLSHRFMRPLNELVRQTQRIARGDFSPVSSGRRYRDEFTTMEEAINRMLRELEARQHSLIEAHKLRAVGILTAGVAHELNNPLNNIMLTAHAVLEEAGELSREEIVEMVKDIVSETERSRAIVRNLLDFTRESESIMEPLQLEKLLEETVRLARNQAKVKRATLSFEAEPNLPRVSGDRQQLKQALLNLILNALDAIGEEGRIGVAVRREATGDLRIVVEDDGCGIPAQVLPNIFDPFFTTKPVGQGTGLGLAVVHGIVTKHGGRIQVQSRPGCTRFEIFLPSMEKVL